MAAIGLIGSIIGGGFSIAGGYAAADAARQQGEAEKQAAYYSAATEERQAMAERATSQRKSFDQRRQEQLVQSSLQAKAAASGAGASDPTVINLASEIAGESEYRALGDMWSGETRGRALETQAGLDRYVGDRKLDQGNLRANAAILGGYGGMFSSLGSGLSKFNPFGFG